VSSNAAPGVANKENILDGIVDLVISEITVPPGRAGWKRAMRKRAISAHEALLRHPRATSLMQSRSRPGPATLRHHDSVLGILRKAGFTLPLAAHAASVMDGYVYGWFGLDLILDGLERLRGTA
jgi:hypothetical protein